MSLTKIEWTGTPLAHDLVLPRAVRLDGKLELAAGLHRAGETLPGFTFNPWVGCQRVSEACRHCYAESWSKRAGYTPDGRHHLTIWGPPSTTPRARTSLENWRRPRRWNRLAVELGVRFKVFCASLADVGEDHPQIGPWRKELFDLIDATPHLDWLLLTKRPANLGASWPWKEAPRNVWAGATMEDQACADRRAGELVEIPAAVHFASVEPMLEEIDLGFALPMANGSLHVRSSARRLARGYHPLPNHSARLRWIIVGGESGAGHRPLDLDAAERVATQAVQHGAAVFVKQDSGPYPGTRGRLSDSMWELKQWPEVRRGEERELLTHGARRASRTVPRRPEGRDGRA